MHILKYINTHAHREHIDDDQNAKTYAMMLKITKNNEATISFANNEVATLMIASSNKRFEFPRKTIISQFLVAMKKKPKGGSKHQIV